MNKGKRQIIQFFNRDILAGVTLLRFVQWACYVSSVAVFMFGLLHLMHSNLTPGDIVVGFLSSSVAPLLFIGAGLALPRITALVGGQVE